MWVWVFFVFLKSFTVQAKVTGTTLNGKKEKLQAPEGDKDKWNFLNFAEAWTPNEGLNESKDEVLFTHVRMYIYKSFSVILCFEIQVLHLLVQICNN